MNQAIRLLLAALGAHRATQFITLDDGPGDVMLDIREKLGVYDLGDDGHPKSGIGRFFNCYHCVGKWVSIPLALTAVFPTKLGDGLLGILGVAGAISIIEVKAGRKR